MHIMMNFQQPQAQIARMKQFDAMAKELQSQKDYAMKFFNLMIGEL